MLLLPFVFPILQSANEVKQFAYEFVFLLLSVNGDQNKWVDKVVVYEPSFNFDNFLLGSLVWGEVLEIFGGKEF